MLNAYYFTNEDIPELFREAQIRLTQSELTTITAVATYAREEYNLPFEDLLGEGEITLTDLLEAARTEDIDVKDYVDTALEDFYFKHQRVYAASLAALRNKEE